MQIKSYNTLPDEARYIRTKVFVEEQGFREEFDTADNYSTHLVAFCDGKPVGVCRFYFDNEKNQYLIGRLAVLKEYRRMHIGAKLIVKAQELIKNNGGDCVFLHSQCRAQPFYESLGYTAFGESDFDEGCPHRWMKKIL